MDSFRKNRQEFILFASHSKNTDVRVLPADFFSVLESSGIEVFSSSNIRDISHLKSSHKIPFLVLIYEYQDQFSEQYISECRRVFPEVLILFLLNDKDTGKCEKIYSAGGMAVFLNTSEKGIDADILKKIIFTERKRSGWWRFGRKLHEELYWAGDFQQSFLSLGLPEKKGVQWDIAYEPLPGLECGGDFYDILDLGLSKYLFVIGDVAGHGIRAAFITMLLKSLMFRIEKSINIAKEISPARILSWINKKIYEEISELTNIIITFSAALLDTEKMVLSYGNAGHLPLLLVRDSKAYRLETAGPALNFSSTSVYKSGETAVRKKDILVFYTDGLVETGGAGTGTGISSLEEELLLIREDRVSAASVLKSLLRKNGKKQFSDDVTLFLVRIGDTE